MESFDVTIDGEAFRISERMQPTGEPSYDFTWLNGPLDGTYGFTVSRAGSGNGGNAIEPATPMTREELVQEAQSFVAQFSEPGGMGKDFPGYVPARLRRSEGRG